MTGGIVSLVPSLTETLLAWGIEPAACTRFCEQPALIHVGGTKDPDIDAIVALAPDLVVMDREENRREDADRLRSRGIEVFATHVTSLADVDEMTRGLRGRLALAPLPPLDLQPTIGVAARSAFVAIWRRPWMTCNGRTYGSSLLASVGVINVFETDSATYPTVELADVAARRPELVLLPSEPYPFKERHADELRQSVPGARVVFVDGQDLFWWGARTPAARERLAQSLSGS